MSDQINKTLILSAKLDTSSIGPDIKKLKESLSMDGMQLDQATINAFKKDFADIAKSFAVELKKAMGNAQGGGAGGGSGSGRGRGAGPQTGRNLLSASDKDIQNFRISQSRSIAKEQNQELLSRQKEELKSAKKVAKESAYYNQYRVQGNNKDQDKALLERRNKELKATKELESAKKREQLKANKESNYYRDYMKSGNDAAMSMPAEQASMKKERDERKKMQKTLAEDKEKREMGILFRLGQASKHYLKTGKFDFIQESGKADFRSKAQGMGIPLPEHEGSVSGRILGARGATAMRAGGALLGAGAAVAGGVVALGEGIRASAAGGRENRSELINKRDELATGAASGNVLEAGIRNKSRKNVGFMEFMESQARGNLGDMFMGRWGDLKNNVGADAELSRRQQQEGDLAVHDMKPLLDAYNGTVKPSLKNRVGMLSGGGLSTGSLTDLQGTGADYGFTNQESLSNLAAVKDKLGNGFLAGEEGKRNFGEMSDLDRRYGIDVGSSAANVESLRSNSSSGMSGSSALTLQRDSLRKAVSAGLDASRTGKFLETTTSYINSNSGLANSNVEGIQDSLLNLARGFAGQGGRSDITETDLSKAKQAREIQKTSSMSFSGLSGAGNYLGVTQAMQDSGISDPDVLLGAMNMSQDADASSYEQLFKGKNISKEAREKFTKSAMASKGDDAFLRGAEGVGLGSNMQGFRSYLRTQESGQSGEGSLALNNMPKLGGLSATGPETQGALGTAELKTVVNESTAEFTQFKTGIQSINEVNVQYTKQTNELIDSLKRASDRLNASFKGGQAPRTVTGENLSQPRGK